VIIGIDPGANGGVAFFYKGKLTCHPMPTWTVDIPLKNPKKKKIKRGDSVSTKIVTHRKETNISVKQLEHLLLHVPISNGFITRQSTKVYVEDIKTFYGMSAQTNFKMGYNLGMIHSLLDRVFGEYYLVEPKVWQEQVWIDSDRVERIKIKEDIKQSKLDTKATSLNAAKRIFPNERFVALDCRTPHDGMFDSALIAYYGSKIN